MIEAHQYNLLHLFGDRLHPSHFWVKLVRNASNGSYKHLYQSECACEHEGCSGLRKPFHSVHIRMAFGRCVRAYVLGAATASRSSFRILNTCVLPCALEGAC